MDDRCEIPGRRRYAWPWFVLGAVVAAIVLAVLWMSAEVRRTREYRDPNPFPAPAPAQQPPG